MVCNNCKRHDTESSNTVVEMADYTATYCECKYIRYWVYKPHVRFYEQMLGATDRKYTLTVERWCDSPTKESEGA